MSELLEYKCPACGGKLEFNSGTQNMKCPFCYSEFDVAAVQEFNHAVQSSDENSMQWETSAGGEWGSGETEGMKVYHCESCGAEIVTDGTTAASKCPYCDSPIVMTGSFSGDLKPDYVIPFKLDKKAATAALNKHLEGKRLLPKIFRSDNHIDEIKGVYVPVWLFDAGADANIVFKAEKERRWSDNEYSYVEKSYYSAVRAGKIAFDNVPVDGSTKMEDDLMESIEPFDFKDAVDFQTAYLSGYLADRYDVTAEESIDRANERIKKSTVDAFKETVTGYNSVTTESTDIRLNNSKAKYALYPVWILNTSWNGNKYTFAMNGQTGRFVGNLPVDKGAAFRWFSAITAIGTAVIFGIEYLLMR
ncbi:MAG: hypothetical protein IKO47_10210 [Ruminococcus sp.]|nr:hypothetical protein [Ruminococcus sp.]